MVGFLNNEEALKFYREKLMDTDFKKRVFEFYLKHIYENAEEFAFDPIVSYVYKTLGEIVTEENYVHEQIRAIELEENK